jgi:hypothetical protein
MVSDGMGVGGELMWCYRDLDHMIGMIGLVVARDGENVQRQREVRRRRRRRQRPAAAAKAAAKAAAGPRWQPRCRARHHRRRGEQGRRRRYDRSTGTGHARAQQGTSRALEWSGGASRGGCDVRIRLGRHAHGEGPGATAAGQPLFIRLFIRSGMLSDPPFGGHLPGNSRTREHLCLVLVCLSAPSSVCLHGTGASCRWQM